MTVEPSWDDGVIWGPPCQCGGEYIPHRHGSSSDANGTWIRTGTMGNVDSSDTRLQDIAAAWKAYRAAARSGSDDELVYRRNKYEALLDALIAGAESRDPTLPKNVVRRS